MQRQIVINLVFSTLITLATLANAQTSDTTASAEAVPEGLVVTSLQIEPSEIKLESPFSYAQIIVTGRLDSGEMLDLTRQASFQIDAKVATTSSIGLVRPLSDGETKLKISWGEFEADIPVSVQGQSQSFEPSFIRDVQPTLSRLGCNAGTCHGSKDGKGGFKLSLRGYDSIFDFSALTDEIGARRFNRVAPDQSLMLLKASGSIAHVGGALTQPGEPYYDLLRSWIAAGVDFDLETSPRVTSIDVEPKLPVLPRAGSIQQMRVVATYSDGATRDVTREAFVESGNIEVIESMPGGQLRLLRRGEAPVLVRYEGAYAATTLTVMGDRSGFAWQDVVSHNYIDDKIYDKLQRVKVLPSELCSDDEFIRRLYLDLTGLPPDSNQVRDFLADPRDTQTKREELIDTLIGSRAYVEYWTNKWADLLQVNRKFLGESGAIALRNWIHDSIATNKPYNKFAREVLTASGSNLANPPAAYWKVLRDPADAMENTTHLFLAIRFNCNKCHDHPFERWTQDQYYEMAAYFSQVGRKEDPKFTGKRIGGTAVEGAVPLVEVVFDRGSGEIKHDRTGEVTAPSFPYDHSGGVDDSTHRRKQLAEWMTAAENPYFARSYVNRIWGYLLGVGIIEPIDDIRAGNPPSNPELLDALEADFIASGFDVQHILRRICRSRAYQRSVKTNEWNDDDTINYSHALPRRLPAEVLFDTFHFAAGAPFRIPGAPEGIRAAQLPDSGVSLPFLDDFGRPVRESACECERSSGVALGPVMKLVNGPSLAKALSDPANDLVKLAAEIKDDQQLVEEMFLRFLARMPSARELELGVETLTLPGGDLADHEAALATYESERSEKQSQWEASYQQDVTWHPLKIENATSDVGADFTPQDDGSWVVSGKLDKDIYRLTTMLPESGITGLRLEALADPNLPAGGPGRGNGNFVLNELIAERFDPAAPEKLMRLSFSSPTADFSQNGWAVVGAVDGNEGTGWAISPQMNKSHHAIFPFSEPISTNGPKNLKISMVQKFSDSKHLLGRFRLSYTTSEGTLNRPALPAELTALLNTPAEERTAEQSSKLRMEYAKTDLKYQRLMKAVEQAKAEAANPRLVGVQDLAWALVNNPSFLFNR